MLIFFLVHFYPLQVSKDQHCRGCGGENELEKKIQNFKERVTKKKFTEGKTKLVYIAGGISLITVKLKLMVY
jgi:hypothetical protein